MAARIESRGYIRVTWTPARFDRILPTWKGKKYRHLPNEEKQPICDMINMLLYSGNFESVKLLFPGERAKTLVKKLVYIWLDSKPRSAGTYKTYTRILNTVFLPRLGDKAVHELTRADFYWIREGWGDTYMARQIRAMIQSFIT